MPSVAIIGASANPDRYSYQAVQRYLAAGYTTRPNHPSGISVFNLITYKTLSELPAAPDIVSLYINPRLGIQMIADLQTSQPQYIWLNPGADSDQLAAALEKAGLTAIRSCNLVALSIGDPLEVAQRIADENQ